MNIRNKRFVIGVGVLLWGFAGQAAEKPNVILILADDLGYADLSCHGSEEIRTPHIDQLAASGIRFEQGYTPSSVCGPSRASILAGRNIWELEQGAFMLSYFPKKFNNALPQMIEGQEMLFPALIEQLQQ